MSSSTATDNPRMRTGNLQPTNRTNVGINSLPDEILVEVFMKLKDTCPLHSWLCVNQVCRHWRSVAVGAPLLWTEPFTRNHDLSMLMLERSQNCGLDVQLDNNTSSITTAAILTHVERIEMLSIRQSAEALRHTDEALLVALGRKALSLKGLEIHHSYQYFRSHVVSPQPFSSILLLPLDQLHIVDFYDIRFDWNMLPIPNLTQLSLQHINWVAQVPGQQIIETLRRMPHLEHLTIHCNNLFQEGPTVMHLDPIYFPNMSSLELRKLTTEEVESILSHIKVPRLCRLSVDCSDRFLRVNDHYVSFLQIISSTVENGEFSTLNTLNFMDNVFDFACQESSLTTASLHLVVPMYDLDRVGPMTTHTLIRITQTLSRLVELRVFSTQTTDKDGLVQLFAHLPFLRSIDLCGGELVSKFVGALKIAPDYTSDTPIPFPALRDITLRKANLPSSLVQAFRVYLTERRQHGAHTQRLCLNYFPVGNENELRLLRELAAEFVSTYP